MGPVGRTLFVGISLIAFLVILTVAAAVWRRGQELHDAARELRTVDLLLTEEVGRSLQSVALVLDGVVEGVRSDGVQTPDDFVARESSKATHDVLRVRVAGVPQLDAVTIVSARGRLVNFSRFWPIPPVDLSDREYFRYLRDHQTDEPHLTEPVINRGSGTPTVYLARRVSAPDGTFLGLVLGAVELGYFDRLYASLRLEPGDFIALWRRDGVLLTRYPPAAAGQSVPPGSIAPSAAAWHGVPGVFEEAWTNDGGPREARVVASQASAGFPLRVNLGRSRAVILADWRWEVITISTAVTLAILCIATVVWAVLRRFRAYEEVAAASRKRERAVEARRLAEDALRQSQKMETLGQLTGGVAHDFNNLLTVVRSSADLLRRPNLAEDRRRRYVDAIVDASERGSRLTGQLLAFARRQALKPETFDIAENVAAVAGLVDQLTGSKVRVETVLPEHPCFVHADPNQFDTAVMNMAVNARDAMPGGGRLVISVGAADRIPRVRAHEARDGTFATVSVSDTGVGIPPDAVDRVFEPFFTTKRVGYGTGLGLSQVHGFAKQSGGEVAVESAPDAGTTFTLFLPSVGEDATVRKLQPTKAGSGVGGNGRRVLVVEDNEQVGRSTVETLHDLGFTTTWAQDAEQALVELEAGRDRFDVVFSDVVMPGMNGIELGRVIGERFADLPVVLTSGYSQALVEEGTRGLPLVRKPYSLDELSRVLSEARPAAPPDRIDA